MITQDELKEFLQYDAETGIFTWLKRTSNRVKIGAVAGTKHCAGYVSISLNGKLYLAHRLAWLYTHGELPKHEIDHINGKRNDNRILNLRQATHKQNLYNTGMFSHNSSGIRGVFQRKDTGKWQAQTKENGRHKSLGCYKTAELAAAAYQDYAQRTFGEFRRNAAAN